MSLRFTLDGSPELEAFLSELCLEAAKELMSVLPRDKIAVILLGGGYGRGEGGVLRGDNGDQLYNDLEFYILHTANHLLMQSRFGEKVHSIADKLSQKAGIEVEFKMLPLSKLRQSEVSMFYYDLMSGHKCIAGDPKYIEACGHHLDGGKIPLHEGTRLLMNRCSGLLYSEARLLKKEFTDEDSDFICRNLAKAKLCFGDVILVVHGLYNWSCRERSSRLTKLKLELDSPILQIEQIREWHREGVEFKLHPYKSKAEKKELSKELTALKKAGLELWLWIEARRLKKKYAAPAEYALDPVDKCPETNRWKNRIINVQRFGSSGLGCSSYPRERLLNTLPLLLWVPEATRKPELLEFGQKQLFTSSRDFSSLVEAYQKIWRNYN